MNALRRRGLRARLAIALAGVAVASIALSTILADNGLQRELARSSEQRLTTDARNLAEVVAQVYAHEHSWTRFARARARRFAGIAGLRVRINAPIRETPAASAAVVVQGERVGTLSVTPADRAVFSEPERDLRSRLTRLHLFAGGIAAALAVAAAVALSAPLAGPLRRLTQGAQRTEEGALDTRVEPAGGPELEQLAQAFNRLVATLEREEELRRDATADLAHELRTPLTGILSRIEAAQDDVLTNRSANLEAMHTEALRLRHLIEDLGRLAEAQQPGMLLAKQPVELAELARQRLDALRPFFAERGIAVRSQLDSAVVSGDAERLEQVIDNLLSNALRYTDTGGTVELHVFSDGDDAVIKVSDTGIGIAAEDLPHVFERFWRSDKSRARTRGGAGIGLAIVHELVRAHDGHIHVTSTPGAGSTFTVRVPTERCPP